MSMTRLVACVASGAIVAAGVLSGSSCVPELHESDMRSVPDGAPTGDESTDAADASIGPACSYDCLGGRCLAGVCQPFAIFEIDDAGLLNDLAVNPGSAMSDGGPDTLYWTSVDGTVYAMPLRPPFVVGDPSATVIESNDVGLFQLTTHSGRVYWTCTGATGSGARIGGVRSNGAVPTTFVAQADGAPPIAPRGVALGDITGKTLVWVNAIPDAATVMASGTEGKNVRVIATLPEAPGRMDTATASPTVYVGCSPNVAGVSGVVYSVDVTTGAVAPVWDASTGQPMFEFVAQTAVNGVPAALYGVQDNSSATESRPAVVRQPLPGGPQLAIALGASAGRGYGIASDGISNLFVATEDTSTAKGRIFRVDLLQFGPDAATEIAESDLAAVRIAYWLAGRSVFWTAHDRRTSKSAVYGMAVAPSAP